MNLPLVSARYLEMLIGHRHALIANDDLETFGPGGPQNSEARRRLAKTHDSSSGDGQSLTLFWRSPNLLTQLPQCPAYAVKLVDQIQNQPYPFIVHAEIHPEIMDELRSGDVNFGEAQLGGRSAGYQPLLLDPGVQCFILHAGERQKLRSADFHGVTSSRGL
jgi:hypothetical protein